VADDDDIQQLQNRLASDDALLARFKQAPHEVFEEHRISLAPHQRDKLASLKLHAKSDEEVKGMVRDAATFKATML
jgi:hypothetical protein